MQDANNVMYGYAKAGLGTGDIEKYGVSGCRMCIRTGADDVFTSRRCWWSWLPGVWPQTVSLSRLGGVGAGIGRQSACRS